METRAQQIEREERHVRAFQRKSDAIARLILTTDLPWVDIAIQINKLREDARRLFPQKMELFERIYVSRYRRLWSQWRQDAPGDSLEQD